MKSEEQIKEMLDLFIRTSKEINNKSIIDILRWVLEENDED